MSMHFSTSAILFVLGSIILPAAHAATQGARAATPLHTCEPAWPEDAPVDPDRRATKLMLQVNAQGAVTGTELVQSSHTAALDNATVDAALGCPFLPALRRGKPVPSTVPFAYSWDKLVVVQQPPPLAAVQVVLPRADFSSCAKPEWPKSSLRNEEMGTVSMAFLIGVDGTVKDAQLKKSSGFVALDNSAIQAIAKCKFLPGTRDGQPVETWAPVQYVWLLQ